MYIYIYLFLISNIFCMELENDGNAKERRNFLLQVAYEKSKNFGIKSLKLKEINFIPELISQVYEYFKDDEDTKKAYLTKKNDLIFVFSSENSLIGAFPKVYRFKHRHIDNRFINVMNFDEDYLLILNIFYYKKKDFIFYFDNYLFLNQINHLRYEKNNSKDFHEIINHLKSADSRIKNKIKGFNLDLRLIYKDYELPKKFSTNEKIEGNKYYSNLSETEKVKLWFFSHLLIPENLHNKYSQNKYSQNLHDKISLAFRQKNIANIIFKFIGDNNN